MDNGTKEPSVLFFLFLLLVGNVGSTVGMYSLFLIFVFIKNFIFLMPLASGNMICRKGLVDIFDKLESGQLKDSSSLSRLVMKLHKNR